MKNLAQAHGLFYVLTGLWPLIHRRSFEAVTGPKTDWWLVQTVGVLVTAIGASLLHSHRRGQAKAETATLALASALGLAAIDTVHSARRTIRPIYLGDALVELALAAAWFRKTR